MFSWNKSVTAALVSAVLCAPMVHAQTANGGVVAQKAEATVESGSLSLGSLVEGGSSEGSVGSSGDTETYQPTTRTETWSHISDQRGAYIESVQRLKPDLAQLFVYSPSFGRVVRVGIQHPENFIGSTRPTLYMLDGLQRFQPAGDRSLYTGSAWLTAGGGEDFFRGKNLNVIYSVDGGPTYYQDWLTPHPTYGKVMWETFLTKELPGLIDGLTVNGQLSGGNGKHGIMGISMGAHSAYMLAVRNAGLYSFVGGMSGCYETASQIGRAQIKAVLYGDKVDPAWIFGGEDNPKWEESDPNYHLHRLRGKKLYLFSATGVPPGGGANPGVGALTGSLTGGTIGEVGGDSGKLLAGGVYEAGSFLCGGRFVQKLAEYDVPVTVQQRGEGVHDWPLWKAQLPYAWPSIEEGLGMREPVQPAPSTSVAPTTATTEPAQPSTSAVATTTSAVETTSPQATTTEVITTSEVPTTAATSSTETVTAQPATSEPTTEAAVTTTNTVSSTSASATTTETTTA